MEDCPLLARLRLGIEKLTLAPHKTTAASFLEDYNEGGRSSGGQGHAELPVDGTVLGTGQDFHDPA